MTAVLPIPIHSVPTWLLLNKDHPNEIPLMGQFDPSVRIDPGKVEWSKKPGIAGGSPWMRQTSRAHETLKFSFHAVANDILDIYPSSAWNKVIELSRRDDYLGRPPQVMFVYGITVKVGYITDLPEAPISYWPNTRITREIGPIDVEITCIEDQWTPPVFTDYVPYDAELVTFEALALKQYNDTRYAAALRIYNQGIASGDKAELPRLESKALSRMQPVAVFLGDPIDGF